MNRISALLVCVVSLLAGLSPTASFAADRQLSAPGRRAVSPEIATSGEGSINVIWLDKGLTAERPPPKPRKPGVHSHRSATDLYFSRSEDSGSTWSKPVRVNDTPGEVWGFSVSKPRIAVGPTGTIHVFYPANDNSAITGKDIVSARYRRSTDGGKSFSAAININEPVSKDKGDILGEGLTMTNSFGTMGVAPDGTVIAAWQNIADMKDESDGADGVVAISTDDGASFSTERVALPGNDICPCCQLTLAFGDDTAYMGLRKIFDDGRDSTVARSTDGGRTFTMAGRLDFDQWDINGCPLKPTELAISGDRVYAAAYTGGESPAGIYFTRSDDGGATFAGKMQVHPGVGYADAPALTLDSRGHVRLVWHAKIKGERRLFTAVSVDKGTSLSLPVQLATPPGNSAHPATAVGANDNVFVAWEQTNEEVFFTQLPPAEPRVAVKD